MALNYYSTLNIISIDASSCVCALLQSRPQTCIAAMNRYDDLRNMFIHMCRKSLDNNRLKPHEISISLPNEEKNTLISLSLLQASLVLIASWNKKQINPELMELIELLLPNPVKNTNSVTFGAAGATFLETNKRVVSVEEVRFLSRILIIYLLLLQLFLLSYRMNFSFNTTLVDSSCEVNMRTDCKAFCVIIS